MKLKWLSSSFWNLLGIGVPFAVAVVCMPLLLRGLGAERYGLLILAWSLVGYFSIFDLGLSRAITQRVSAARATEGEDGSQVVVTGVAVLGILGTVAGVLLWLSAPLTDRVGSIPDSMRLETFQAVRILGIGLPFVLTSAGLRGALEGALDFTGMNVIRGAAGIGTYVTPVAIMLYTPHLDMICAGLVTVRALSCLGYLARCTGWFGAIPLRRVFDWTAVRDLLDYGTWITVSNVVSPVMAYLDRFLVAGALSVSLAGYYSTSQEVVTRFQIVPSAILSVLFPAIARYHRESPSEAAELFVRSTRVIAWMLLPAAAGAHLFAHDGLELWFGTAFADGAATVTKVLIVGSFVNCLALGPYTLLQAVGRPDVTAKIHLVELPVYLGALAVLTGRYGLLGVGVAWSGRMVLDLLILLWAARSQAPRMGDAVARSAREMAIPIVALALTGFVDALPIRILVLAAVAARSLFVLRSEWTDGDIKFARSRA